jgi:hypothetical protein
MAFHPLSTPSPDRLGVDLGVDRKMEQAETQHSCGLQQFFRMSPSDWFQSSPQQFSELL